MPWICIENFNLRRSSALASSIDVKYSERYMVFSSIPLGTTLNLCSLRAELCLIIIMEAHEYTLQL